MRSNRILLTVVASAAILTACSQTEPERTSVQSSALGKGSSSAVLEVFGRVGRLAEDSFYSCLLNGYVQGLPLAQVIEECSTKLLDDDQKGFGGPLGELTAKQQSFFDPNSVRGACNSGDPKAGQDSGTRYIPGYGTYSWGKESQHEHGLSQKESRDQKDAAIKAAKDEAALRDKMQAAEMAAGKAAKEAQDKAAAAKAEAERKVLYEKAVEQTRKAEEAKKKAQQDPNQKPVPEGRSVDGGTPCEQALQSARELLRECHRTSWKNFDCQKLLASMNGCPDPALILVDPDQGYTCGEKPDPEAVKDAVVARCEERAKYGPDGANPCEPPSVEPSARHMRGKGGDICDDTQAYRDPDSDACLGTFQSGGYFGQPNLQQLIIIAMEKFGGPLFVLPVLNPPAPPGGGPDPRPGPK